MNRTPRPRLVPPARASPASALGRATALPRLSGSARWWWALGVVLLGVAIELWVANSDQPHAFGDAVLRAFEDILSSPDRHR